MNRGMKSLEGFRVRPCVRLLALAWLAALLAPGPVAAQPSQDSLKFNAPYSCPGPSRLIVIGCKGTDDFDQCDVQYLNDAAPNGLGARLQVYRQTLVEQLGPCKGPGGDAAANRPTPPPKPAGAVPPENTPLQAPPQRAMAPMPARPAEGCSSDPDIADRASPDSPLDKVFKHKILEDYQASINGSTTSPVKVGVTFEAFQIGEPRINRMTPQGLEFVKSPVGEKIYPVKTRHTFCRVYNNAMTRTLYEGRYDCVKDTHGDWTCPPGAGHRILGYR